MGPKMFDVPTFETGNSMEEETRDKEVAAMIGALSAVQMQLQEVEETTLERAQIFYEKAEQSDSPTSLQFNTGCHLLRVIGGEVRETQEYIDRLVEFLRLGTTVHTKSQGRRVLETSGRLEQTQVALTNAVTSFEEVSTALFVAGRALEAENLDTYAEYLYTLSERLEAKTERARSILEQGELQPTAQDPALYGDPS